jgi:hypothetical protein
VAQALAHPASPNAVHAQLEQLWHTLADNPSQQALAVATRCVESAPHLAAEWAARITNSIPDATFKRLLFSAPEDGRIQALNLLANARASASRRPTPANPPIVGTHFCASAASALRQPPALPDAEQTYQTLFGVAPVVRAPAEPIRVDWEQGRLAIALHQAAPFRLWLLGRDLTRRGDGSGVVTRKALWGQLKRHNITYTRRHFNRLLASGEGLFWHTYDDQLYLRSTVKVGRDLCRSFGEKSPNLGNLPGVRDVLIDPTGSMEQFEATLYAAWIAGRGYKEDVTISREVLSKLFRRDQTTLRRWEADRLDGLLTKRTNYAQCPSVDRYFGNIPEHSQPYLAHVQHHDGSTTAQKRLRWQLPNTYHATLPSHAHRGQAAKVRRTVQTDIPVVQQRDGHCRLYYTSERYTRRCKSVKFRMGKLGDVHRAVYVYLGQHKRTQHGIYEISSSGFTFTDPNERARPTHERAHFGLEAARLEGYKK